MKTKTGKFGAQFQNQIPPIDIIKLLKAIICTLVVLYLCFMWLKWSEQNDKLTQQVYDKCYTSYYNSAISSDFEKYMQDCMK